MKYSKPSSALILIASTLLLSVVRNVTAKGVSQPNRSTQTQTPAGEHSSVPSPSVSPVYQPAAAATAKPSATFIYNQYGQASPLGNVPTWLEAIATILLVIFAGRQLGSFKEAANAAKDNAEAAKDAAVSTKRYVEMTEQMVEVARQSARAAKLALRADRPALVIKFVVPEYKETAGNTSTVSGEIYLQNLGKGPAVITKAVSALRVQQKDLLSLEPPDHSQCSRSWIDQPVVSPATTVIMGLSNSLQLSSREFEHVAKLRWTIVAYGRLSYRDPAFEEEEYEMVFQWIYRPPKEEKPDGDFLLGYAEHQRWK